MNETKQSWITSINTTDAITGDKHRVAFFMQGFDTQIKFEKLPKDSQEKQYQTVLTIPVQNISNSGLIEWATTSIFKLGAQRTDEMEAKYAEVIKPIFSQEGILLLRMTYMIAPGQKSDYKRQRSASIRIYRFQSYQEMKPGLQKAPNGSYPNIPETALLYRCDLSLMPLLNASGMGGKNMSNGESFLQAFATILTAIHQSIIHSRVFHHISDADHDYESTKKAVQETVTATSVETTPQIATTYVESPMEEGYPF